MFSFRNHCIIGLLIIITGMALKAEAQPKQAVRDTLTQTVLIHPVIRGDHIVSSEHEFNANLRLGDQLGRDFMISQITDDGFLRSFEGDGRQNTDWYGWRKEVLAPISGKVTRVNHPDTTNQPGTMNRDAQPGLIFFERADSTTVIYAHIREISVEEGDRVSAGEVVGKVGNNGNSRAPHIHVGAWRKEIPLQIQVDLYAAERKKGSGKASQ